MDGTTASSTDMFAMAAEERLRLANLLDDLTPEQWESPSSCSDWSVRLVAGHLIAGPELGMSGLVAEVFRSRGNPDVANDRLARRMAERPTTEIVAAMREFAHSTFSPPVLGAAAPLTDAVIHALDIARPLGLEWEPAPNAVLVALKTGTSAMFRTANHYRGFKGLQFVAADADWRWGSGDKVEANAVDLAHILWGRSDAIELVDGPGTQHLRAVLSSIR